MKTFYLDTQGIEHEAIILLAENEYFVALTLDSLEVIIGHPKLSMLQIENRQVIHLEDIKKPLASFFNEKGSFDSFISMYFVDKKTLTEQFNLYKLLLGNQINEKGKV